MTTSMIRQRPDRVAVETYTRTTHYVHVNLADLLDRFGIEDEVVLTIATPSGRSKRVAIPANLLIPPHHVEEPSHF